VRNTTEGKKEYYEPALSMLTHDLEARGDDWDQPPQLAFLYEADDGLWRVSELPLPDTVWIPEPGRTLSVMAASLEPGTIQRFIGDLVFLRPAGWRGVAFFCEAWSVQQSGDELDPILDEMSKARMLHQHPARVECRSWWAAMPDGTFLRSVLNRESEHIDQCIITPDDPQHADTGRVPAALSTMARIFGGMQRDD
jgi:hypothetical protein